MIGFFFRFFLVANSFFLRLPDSVSNVKDIAIAIRANIYFYTLFSMVVLDGVPIIAQRDLSHASFKIKLG